MIQVQTIDGLLLRDMVAAGTSLLEKNRDAVDALNVFPVPDGDTGTNMSLTMMSSIKEANAKECVRASEAAEALAKGSLKGARGNSGVITSQLYRGFARALEGVDKITPTLFAQALKAGADTAYKALMKPKEGTILTVARVIAEDALKQVAIAPDDFDALFNVILTSGEAILRKTQEMLPALTQAGVVDAGGRGLLIIYTGYAAVLRGEEIEATSIDFTGGGLAAGFEDDHDAIGEIEFAYCTEFLIEYLKPTVTDDDVDSFRRRLNRIGDCVLVVGDLSLVKVHCHTNNPGKALQYGLELGELVNLKIENMVEQRRERTAAAQANKAQEPEKDFGMVAISLGEGFSQIFTDLTVDHIVDGGQTMNPSIDDILEAINGVNAKCVFVLPNNGNVILAAQQAVELTEKEAYVIPTKNVAMGIAAAVAFQPDISGEENAKRMDEAAQRVKTGTVTYAVRDSKQDDLDIKEGDIIGLANGKIDAAGHDIPDVVMELMEKVVDEDSELITVYYGADTSEEDARKVTDALEEKYDYCDVEMHCGGQPLYFYLISVE